MPCKSFGNEISGTVLNRPLDNTILTSISSLLNYCSKICKVWLSSLFGNGFCLFQLTDSKSFVYGGWALCCELHVKQKIKGLFICHSLCQSELPSRMRFWKRLLWNMARTNGHESPPFFIENLLSSAKQDGMFATRCHVFSTLNPETSFFFLHFNGKYSFCWINNFTAT